MKKLLLLLLLIPMSAKAMSAHSYVVMDMENNRILEGSNIHEVRSVASISKIMTAVVAIESGKLDDKITIGDEILKSYGSGVYIQIGEVLTLRDLVYGLMLRSGNDAAIAIAYYVGGSLENFVALMNEKAQMLGMNDTTFNNPSGLDEKLGNYSTAYDMAILTSYAMKNKEYQKIVKTKKYVLETNKNVYSWTNKNKLLNESYITGGKTGYTIKAKRTLVSTGSKNKMKLVVVTLNDPNDWEDHKSLYNKYFSTYKRYQILKKGKLNIIDNYYDNYDYYLKKDFYYLLKEDEKDIVIKYEIKKDFKIQNNKKIGKVKVFLKDKEIYQDNIYLRRQK